MIGSYIARPRGRRGHLPSPSAVLAERDRITDEYRALLADESRQAFDEQLALARTVFPHIEDHNFYIDHWSSRVFWNKVREFGALLAAHGFLADQEDVFFLRHDEVRSALEELRLTGARAAPGSPAAPRYWPPIVERRKTIYEAMRRVGSAPGARPGARSRSPSRSRSCTGESPPNASRNGSESLRRRRRRTRCAGSRALRASSRAAPA